VKLSATKLLPGVFQLFLQFLRQLLNVLSLVYGAQRQHILIRFLQLGIQSLHQIDKLIGIDENTLRVSIK